MPEWILKYPFLKCPIMPHSAPKCPKILKIIQNIHCSCLLISGWTVHSSVLVWYVSGDILACVGYELDRKNQQNFQTYALFSLRPLCRDQRHWGFVKIGLGTSHYVILVVYDHKWKTPAGKFWAAKIGRSNNLVTYYEDFEPSTRKLTLACLWQLIAPGS